MKALSLFSGVGGLDLAAEWAGIEVKAFCEIEPFCQFVLRKHWPSVPIFDDIYELRGRDVEPVDIVYGGAPCQPFSVAGKGLGEKDERHLWPEMYRLIGELTPRWVVFENVPGIIRRGLDFVLSDMETANYTSWPICYGVDLFNGEHKRERVFVVSRRSIDESDRQTSSNVEEFGVEELRSTGECFTHPLVKSLLPLGTRDGKWEVEPDVRRAVHGISRRVDRLRALGNAVVPQQAYPIFKAIVEMERRNKTC